MGLFDFLKPKKEEAPVAEEEIPATTSVQETAEGAHIDFADSRPKTMEELAVSDVLQGSTLFALSNLRKVACDKPNHTLTFDFKDGAEAEAVFSKLQHHMKYLAHSCTVKLEEGRLVFTSVEDSTPFVNPVLKFMGLDKHIPDAEAVLNDPKFKQHQIDLIVDGATVPHTMKDVADLDVPDRDELFRRGNLESIHLEHDDKCFTLRLMLKDVPEEKLASAVTYLKDRFANLGQVERNGKEVVISSPSLDMVGGPLALFHALHINIDDPNLHINGRVPNQRVERIAVVGGGMAGMTAATELARKSEKPQVVHLIKPANEPWGGLAYGRAGADDYSYAPADSNFVQWSQTVAREGWDFDPALASLNWDASRLQSSYSDEALVPRQNIAKQLYHQLLEQKLYARNVSIRFEQGTVMNASAMHDKSYLKLDDGSKIFYDHAIVATGHSNPVPVPAVESAKAEVQQSLASDAYIPSIYHDGMEARLHAIPEGGTALILGTSHEAMEAAQRLLTDGKASKIIMLSKTGDLVPLNHPDAMETKSPPRYTADDVHVGPSVYYCKEFSIGKKGETFLKIDWGNNAKVMIEDPKILEDVISSDPVCSARDMYTTQGDIPAILLKSLAAKTLDKLNLSNKDTYNSLFKDLAAKTKEMRNRYAYQPARFEKETEAQVKAAIAAGKIQVVKGVVELVQPSGGSAIEVSYVADGEKRSHLVSADLVIQADGHEAVLPKGLDPKEETNQSYLGATDQVYSLQGIQKHADGIVQKRIDEHTLRPDSPLRQSALYYEWGKTGLIEGTYLVNALQQAKLADSSHYKPIVDHMLDSLNRIQEVTLKEFNSADYKAIVDRYKAGDLPKKLKLEEASSLGVYFVNKNLSMLQSITRVVDDPAKLPVVLNALDSSLRELKFLARNTQINVADSVAEYCHNNHRDVSILNDHSSSLEDKQQFHAPKNSEDYIAHFNRYYELEKRANPRFELSDEDKIKLVSGTMPDAEKIEHVEAALDQGNIASLGESLNKKAVRQIVDHAAEGYVQHMVMAWSDFVKETTPILAGMYNEHVKAHLDSSNKEQAEVAARIEQNLSELQGIYNGKITDATLNKLGGERNQEHTL